MYSWSRASQDTSGGGAGEEAGAGRTMPRRSTRDRVNPRHGGTGRLNGELCREAPHGAVCGLERFTEQHGRAALRGGAEAGRMRTGVIGDGGLCVLVRSESTGRPDDFFCAAAAPSPTGRWERRGVPPRSSADTERRALSGRAAFAVRAPRCEPCGNGSEARVGSEGPWFARVRRGVRPAVGTMSAKAFLVASGGRQQRAHAV